MPLVSDRLERLETGQQVLFGGNRVTTVSPELAAAFVAGDRVVVVQTTGDLLHVPSSEYDRVSAAVERAHSAFAALGTVPDVAISAFFEAFARRLEDDSSFAPILAANEADVADARSRGRSTTRLVLSPKMRSDMVAGLRVWRDFPVSRDALVDSVVHEGWTAEIRRAPLGVIGFVFEGRPNVFADATGVIRTGNTVVFRIGSDALGTARAIVEHALAPALREAGLPEGAAVLVDSPSRASGWALFDQSRLALAVARGSGHAVDQLGAVARQAGIPVSLHGTGGAWIVAGEAADADCLEQAVYHSLDRKVCNTVNVVCVPASRATELVPVVLAAAERAGERRSTVTKLHVTASAAPFVGAERFGREVEVHRAEGTVREMLAERIEPESLGVEWEWEETPEVSLCVVDDVAHAIGLFNTYSPRLVASLISEDDSEQAGFWSAIDSPFVGNGFTRWVDGQFALDKPELGLSNWENGRLFARSGVLGGDSAFTMRIRAVQDRPDIHR
jgi:glutamate-5-semialdehyde dehydrogenase